MGVRRVPIKVLYHSQKFKLVDWTHCVAWLSSMGIKPEYQSIFALFSDHLSVPENELITTAFVNNVVSADDSVRNTQSQRTAPSFVLSLNAKFPLHSQPLSYYPTTRCPFLPFLPIERPLFPLSHRSVSF